MKEKLFAACCAVALLFGGGGIANAFNIDHYECFKAKFDEDSMHDLWNQFHGEATAFVGNLKYFCAPTAKDGTYPDDLLNPDDHLACYEINGTLLEKVRFEASNQFNLDFEVRKVKKAKLLCVPTNKGIVYTDEDPPGVPPGIITYK